jgi:putative transposase
VGSSRCQCAAFAAERIAVKNLTASARGNIDEPGTKVKQKAGLNRAIFDTAPTRQLKPSQRCPCCRRVVREALSERVHRCTACGCVEDRDVAAARVVLRWLEDQLHSGTGREPAVAASATPQRNSAQSVHWMG